MLNTPKIQERVGYIIWDFEEDRISPMGKTS